LAIEPLFLGTRLDPREFLKLFPGPGADHWGPWGAAFADQGRKRDVVCLCVTLAAEGDSLAAPA
jgi:hypothetical protein